MSKPALIQRIIRHLKNDLSVMEGAAAEARDNATGDETRSEGKYDTRAIEAAYLAGAQAERAGKLSEALRLFEAFDPPIYESSEAIGPGALVETEHNGEIVSYLLAPAAGGLTLDYNGFDLTVLTPDSRLYQQLLGNHCGEILDDPPLMVLEIT